MRRVIRFAVVSIGGMVAVCYLALYLVFGPDILGRWAEMEEAKKEILSLYSIIEPGLGQDAVLALWDEQSFSLLRIYRDDPLWWVVSEARDNGYTNEWRLEIEFDDDRIVTAVRVRHFDYKDRRLEGAPDKVAPGGH